MSACSGEIWLADGLQNEKITPVKAVQMKKPAGSLVEVRQNEGVRNEDAHFCEAPKVWQEETAVTEADKPYEEMTVEELQQAILGKMRKNGPVTDYMLGTVRENTHRGSLLNWVRSFNC